MNQSNNRPWESEYRIERTDIVAETTDLRVLRITLTPGEHIPWHYHTAVADQFFCIEGELTVETEAPADLHTLTVGDECRVAAGIAHVVANKGDSRCRFLLVQGVGKYDYCPKIL